MSRHDDALDDEADALSFGDEDDPTHVAHAPGPDSSATATDATAPAEREATGSALLVLYGVFGGAYLLFVVGWIVAAQRDTVSVANLFFEVMRQFGQFLAIASPVLWFVAAFALTRHSRPIVRILWLVVGVIVVAPWPFVFPGASA